MVNLNLLSDSMRKSGMTVTAIATKCGIKRETLYKRLSGDTEFKASEISNLAQVLGLDNVARDKIFFDRNGE